MSGLGVCCLCYKCLAQSRLGGQPESLRTGERGPVGDSVPGDSSDIGTEPAQENASQYTAQGQVGDIQEIPCPSSSLSSKSSATQSEGIGDSYNLELL